MQTLSLNLPSLYGDHHVIEIRRILLAIPGIDTVYASSCFQVVEVTYDPAQVNPDTIKARLEEAGYLEDLPVPSEAGEIGQTPYFRHTAAYQQTGESVSFAQQVYAAGSALWPCPGLGVIKTIED
jgi:copper chaperone CopZ